MWNTPVSSSGRVLKAMPKVLLGSGRLSQTYLVPLSRRLFSSQLLASAFLVLSRALVSSCMTWKRSTVWAAPGMASARPSE